MCARYHSKVHRIHCGGVFGLLLLLSGPVMGQSPAGKGNFVGIPVAVSIFPQPEWEPYQTQILLGLDFMQQKAAKPLGWNAGFNVHFSPKMVDDCISCGSGGNPYGSGGSYFGALGIQLYGGIGQLRTAAQSTRLWAAGLFYQYSSFTPEHDPTLDVPTQNRHHAGLYTRGIWLFRIGKKGLGLGPMGSVFAGTGQEVDGLTLNAVSFTLGVVFGSAGSPQKAD